MSPKTLQLENSVSIQTVKDADALPPVGFHTIYIVSSCDPRYVIESKNGAVYQREDGAAWQGDGYHVEERPRR